MNLVRGDFAAFFAALHRGQEPYRWQQRMLDSVLDDGRWPDQVVAPTGSGKTSVIDVHVFAQALAVSGEGPRLPRRLAMVVDRRVLVDDQYEYAKGLASQLAQAWHRQGAGVLGTVADLLWSLHRSPAEQPTALLDRGLSPLVVGRLRGGSLPSRGWRDKPTAATVLCATPEMWGSRLLFRGYGSTRVAWPREAGLLAMDSVVVVDEAHLARQLLCTARRVSQLARVAERPVLGLELQVVETTATPVTGGGSTPAVAGAAVGVDDEDLEDPRLAARLTRPKPVTLVPVKSWESAKPGGPAVKALADAVSQLLVSGSEVVDATSTVGCFVNTVACAVAVTAELRGRKVSGRAPRVVMVCGQVRPVDLDRLRARYPGLLSPAGSSEVDVVVTTQSLEVGVDVDFAAVVTELASGSALAQRAGRVNRQGLRASGPIVVTVPEGGEPGGSAGEVIGPKIHSGPYGPEELREAMTWLHICMGSQDGLAPWGLRRCVPPVAQNKRVLYQRPELAEAWHWARTSDDLATEPDLDLWLAEDFQEDTSVGFVVRDSLPVDSADALTLVAALRPRDHEVFSVPYRTARAVLRNLHAETGDDGQEFPTTIVVRGEDLGLLQWAQPNDGQPGVLPRLRPGDIVVLDSSVKLFTSSDGDDFFSPPVVVPVDHDGEQPERCRADDVLEAEADLPGEVWNQRAVGGVVHRLELVPPLSRLVPASDSLVQVLTPDERTMPESDERKAVRLWLQGVGPTASRMVREAAGLLGQSATQSEVIVHRDLDGQPTRVLILDRRRAAADEGMRQVWTPVAREVSLATHQDAVASRAASLAEYLGLPGELVEALRLAGAHHDDGKRDFRFQRRLGADGELLLAKSRAGTTAAQARRNERSCGLPNRWRHEQRSVVESWALVRTVSGLDRQLVSRLVGTSHGHGRSSFPHVAGELLLPEDSAGLHEATRTLFDLGAWDELVEATQYRYGVWGCAYLEAVLRAADGQVSREGS